MDSSTARIAFFAHDTFGLGHIKRSYHLIQALGEILPYSSLLLISGSPILNLFKTAPPNADFIKIPTVVKTGASGTQPPHLPISIPEVISMRAHITREALLEYNPDLFIVDNFPLGSSGELLPVLKELKRMHVRTILGLRDILDAPEVVRADWQKQNLYDVLDRYYDRILIYGVRQIFDVVEAYNIPSDIASRLHYCGYLTATNTVEECADEVRRQLGCDGPLVVVTGGGGGDAFPLLDTYLQALTGLPAVHSLLITGPLMSPADRRLLKDRAGANPRIIFREFLPDLPAYLKAADLVISMCGYNMAAELILHRPRALVVPRTWKYGEHAQRVQTTEEREQIMRAEALAASGLIQMLRPERLSPSHLAEKVRETMQWKPGEVAGMWTLSGLQNAVSHIREMLNQK